MEWRTYYWGIEVIAETEDDKRVLADFYKILPTKPITRYVSGDASLFRRGEELILELHR